jgi:hypothetical protein
LHRTRSERALNLKILSGEEVAHSTLWSAVTSVLATVMSPVGLTILIGDLLKGSKRDEVRGAVLAYTVRDAIKNATYIGGYSNTAVAHWSAHWPDGCRTCNAVLH